MKVVKWSEWDTSFEISKQHLYNYTKEHWDCVAEAARAAGYRFPGEYHQNGEFGVPIFDNGIPFMVTYREWGAVMAKAWPEIIDKWCDNKKCPERKDHKHTYVAFAWYSDELKDVYVYPKGEVS